MFVTKLWNHPKSTSSLHRTSGFQLPEKATTPRWHCDNRGHDEAHSEGYWRSWSSTAAVGWPWGGSLRSDGVKWWGRKGWRRQRMVEGCKVGCGCGSCDFLLFLHLLFGWRGSSNHEQKGVVGRYPLRQFAKCSNNWRRNHAHATCRTQIKTKFGAQNIGSLHMDLHEIIGTASMIISKWYFLFWWVMIIWPDTRRNISPVEPEPLLVVICLNCVSGSQAVEAQQEIAAMLAGEGCEGRMPWWRTLVNGSGWLVGSLNVLSSWNNYSPNYSPGVLYLSLFETMWDLLKHQGLKPHFVPRRHQHR